MSLVARFLNGPHAGQDMAIPEVKFILEAYVPGVLICDITEPSEPVMPAWEIVQYRYVGNDGNVLYYTLNREMTHAMSSRQLLLAQEHSLRGAVQRRCNQAHSTLIDFIDFMEEALSEMEL